MMRRSPTRIDLRLDDLMEYESMRKEREAKKEADRQQGSHNIPSWSGKIPQAEIQERVGYIPQSPQTSVTRTNVTL